MKNVQIYFDEGFGAYRLSSRADAAAGRIEKDYWVFLYAGARPA
jgi:hypothetical protein